VGTAGHIDHGKTSLVHALTGIDTDRLKEEKQRGISIDIGFAHLTLPGGEHVSFIDVPGHERFVRNMLAGAGGIEAVVLVVAADESVKPQTREHFDICRLLGLKRGLVVLSKADLASPDQVAKTQLDVHNLTAGSFLAGAPVIPVSSVTRQGFAELTSALQALAATSTRRNANGLARLPIDRSFALKGFGTVVTGTLWSGTLSVGENVLVHPLGREARIRGLQTHGKPVETAPAGERTAVNLTGIDHSEIKRGFVLSQPKTFQLTSVLDASVDWIDTADIPAKREEFVFHIGTNEVMGSLKRLGFDSPFARVQLAEPLIALPGDRFVLRRPSPASTVAGGTVVDAFPPRRLNRAKTYARLNILTNADLRTRIALLVDESASGETASNLVHLTGTSVAAIRSAVEKNAELLWIDPSQRIVSKMWLELRRQKLTAWLATFHASNPTAPGAPISQARLGLEPGLADIVFQNFAAIRLDGDLVSLASHRAQFTPQQTETLTRIEQAFRAGGFQPPSPADAMKALIADPKKARDALETLIKSQKLVRVAADMVFHADVIAHIRQSLAGHKGRAFSVPEFKSWTGISRKYAIPLLEYLDHQRVTKRAGDMRVVL
jgi:selenocysteine-specific elongation factor